MMCRRGREGQLGSRLSLAVSQPAGRGGNQKLASNELLVDKDRRNGALSSLVAEVGLPIGAWGAKSEMGRKGGVEVLKRDRKRMGRCKECGKVDVGRWMGWLQRLCRESRGTAMTNPSRWRKGDSGKGERGRHGSAHIDTVFYNILAVRRGASSARSTHRPQSGRARRRRTSLRARPGGPWSSCLQVEQVSTYPIRNTERRLVQ